jgi:hypothetical protein
VHRRAGLALTDRKTMLTPPRVGSSCLIHEIANPATAR